jgi:hypothetical protein
MSGEQQLLINYNKDSNEILNQISGEIEMTKPGHLKKRPLSFSNFNKRIPISEAKNKGISKLVSVVASIPETLRSIQNQQPVASESALNVG